MYHLSTFKVLVTAFLVSVSCSIAQADDLIKMLDGKKVLFMGDSITAAGHYVTVIETQLRASGIDPKTEFINLGLPSETCSGLSEPDHPFPRPNVQERLERALAKIKPDVVFACYGMNDGIYHPFSEERFQGYQTGVKKIIAKTKAAGAKLILMSPPPFDPLPLRNKGKLAAKDANQFAYFVIYENYDNEVLKPYGDWVMTLEDHDDVEAVIDLHGPVNAYVTEQRKSDPQFTMSGDGVHLNKQGHDIMAETILKALGMSEFKEVSPEVQSLISQRQKVLHDAWLSEVGHLRPGVKAGLPIEEAKQKAADLKDKAIKLLSE